jgi:hypothetical protein
MTELLAVLISAFVVYVLYEIFKTVSESDLAAGGAGARTATHAGKTAQPAVLAEPKPAPAILHKPIPQAAIVQAESKPQPKPAPAPAPKVAVLRNPLTGEESPVPGNYRFAKKWIKEAMVAEGLLKKVYKNSELTEAVSPKVKEAIEQFKQLPQYH